jgi:hypothetical protein
MKDKRPTVADVVSESLLLFVSQAYILTILTLPSHNSQPLEPTMKISTYYEESDSDDDSIPLVQVFAGTRRNPAFSVPTFDESDDNDDSIPPPAFSSRYSYLPSATVAVESDDDDDDDSIPPQEFANKHSPPTIVVAVVDGTDIPLVNEAEEDETSDHFSKTMIAGLKIQITCTVEGKCEIVVNYK